MRQLWACIKVSFRSTRRNKTHQFLPRTLNRNTDRHCPLEIMIDRIRTCAVHTSVVISAKLGRSDVKVTTPEIEPVYRESRRTAMDD